jgi:hypothetical protein
MTEAEYTALIPKPELALLNSLLQGIYNARGFGGDRLALAAGWEQVWDQASATAGWDADFAVPGPQFVPQELQLLITCLDKVFLAGQLQRAMEQQGVTGGLRVVPGVFASAGNDWLAHFVPQQHTVALKASKWTHAQLSVSPACPADYEGARCTSRLHVLLHTLAHEMVHALVFYRLPHIDAASPAYLADERHGPIFRWLNLKLFGHTSEDFKRTTSRRTHNA